MLNHKGDKNAYWSDVPPLTTTGALLITDANRLRYGTSGDVARLLSAIPWTSEFDINLTCYMLTNLATYCIRFRWDTAGDQYYQIRFASSTNQVKFEKRVSGVTTTLGNSSYTFSANTALTVKVEVRNATKKVFINGVQTFSTTDNVLASIGRVGIFVPSGTTMSNTTGIHIDSLEVTSPHLFGRVLGVSVSKAVPHLNHHLAGRVVGVSRTLATARAARHLKGKAIGVSRERATARAARHLSGKVVGVSKERATARAARHLYGEAVGVSRERATARAARHLSGRAVGVEKNSASALHLLHHFGGRAINASVSVATARAARHLSGYSVSLSVGEGVARVARHLAGTSVGSGTTRALAHAARHLTGRSESSSAAFATARVARHLSGFSVGVSLGKSTLLVEHHLMGQSIGRSSERAEIRIIIPRAAQLSIANFGVVSLSVRDEKANR